MEQVPRSPDGVWTIAVAGAAGDGIREAGIYFSHFLDRLGFFVFTGFYYPSLIRGGHNVARMTFADEKVRSDHKALDVLVATNLESVRLHAQELKEDAIVLIDEKFADEARGLARSVIALPIERFVKEMNVPHAAGTAVALGALTRLIGLPKEEAHRLSEEALSFHRFEWTLALADKGYAYAEEAALPEWKVLRGTHVAGEREVVGGNKAAGKGLIAAGLECFFAYPMTPSTSLLTYLARERIKAGFALVHPEDELAVMNMAIGAAFAGKRAAVTTGTGGFALMQEGFSLAGISETPIVAVVSQRQGPATGVPTHTAQADLQFVLHSGHGEFPRFVFAPGDSEEAFYWSAHALNLAWEFQTPAIILLDKTISESLETGTLRMEAIVPARGKCWDGSGDVYRRYRITDDGVSPFASPGTPHAVVKGTSYEHDEDGIATEDPKEVFAMQEKRFRKAAGMRGALSMLETIKVYGDKESDAVLLVWGSTKGPAIEAMRYIDRPVRVVQVIVMDPFDEDAFRSAIGSARRVIAVEGNHDAQLAALVREKTGIVATDKILHYDSTPFSSHMIAERVNKILSSI